MGTVVIYDQRKSSIFDDRIEVASSLLDEVLGRKLTLPLVRTAGDEMQAVIGDPSGLPTAVEFCLRDGNWWLGIGLGRIDSLGATARESRGEAFVAAREAIERAKRGRRSPIAVRGNPPEIAERMEGMCTVLGFLFNRRTERQWEVVDAARAQGSGSRAGEKLGITSQSANRAMRAAGYYEQLATEAEIGYLAAEADRWDQSHAG